MKNFVLLIIIVLMFCVHLQAQLTEPNGTYGGPVSALAINENEIYAGTSGGGLWHRPMTDFITSVKDYLSGLPEGFILEQNFPNPFNPSTTITYRLEKTTEVSLIVYNNLGQEVLVLVNGIKQEGFHSIRFNASNLASGVYYYRMQAGEYVQTKKLMLLR